MPNFLTTFDAFQFSLQRYESNQLERCRLDSLVSQMVENSGQKRGVEDSCLELLLSNKRLVILTEYSESFFLNDLDWFASFNCYLVVKKELSFKLATRNPVFYNMIDGFQFDLSSWEEQKDELIFRAEDMITDADNYIYYDTYIGSEDLIYIKHKRQLNISTQKEDFTLNDKDWFIRDSGYLYTSNSDIFNQFLKLDNQLKRT
jgi:hypothetical protein